MAVIPAAQAVAYSNAIECPGCRAQLEVSDGSRMLATLAGLLAGLLVWRLTSGGEGTFAWVLPVFYSFLAYGVVSPLALMFLADLRLRPETPAEAVGSSHAAAGHH